MARVLVVDNDADIRMTLRLLLEDAGHEVEECEDGPECLAALRASAAPLVVLLDNRMTGMTGMTGEAVLREVAAAPVLAARHSFVLLTASPHSLEPSEQHIPAGLRVPVVAKPFDLDVLLRAVAQATLQLVP